MYIQVIPLTHTFGTEALTYAVGDIFRSKVIVGGLVKIPFGRKDVIGIVSAFQKSGEQDIADIRRICDVITMHAILTPTILTTIARLSRKYLMPIGRVAGFFLPTPVINRLTKQGFPVFPQPVSHTPRHEIMIAQDRILSASDIMDRTMGGAVIICPDDIFLESMRDHDISNTTLFLRQDATTTRRAQAWIDIAQGKYQRIVGTRHLLYYNLSQYPDIYYLEDAFATEHYHYPARIQYRDILAHIVDMNEYSLHIYTSAPRLTTLSQFHYFPIHYIHTACPINSTSFSPVSSDISKPLIA